MSSPSSSLSPLHITLGRLGLLSSKRSLPPKNQARPEPAAAMAEADPLLPDKRDAVPAPFYYARNGKPQCIGHRGYKALYPENTMASFRGTVEVGADAIETDLRMSKDGVVVISHDADLKRCYGKPDKIADCDWAELAQLRTLKEPHEPMPQFKDLLVYLTKPGLEDIWVMLDIKPDQDGEAIMRLIAATIAEVKPTRAWSERLVLGVWAYDSLPYCREYLPGHPISHIGFSISYARKFLKVPNVSFNMFQSIMVGPFGESFRRDIRAAGRPLFLWTVNDEAAMKWSIRKEADGVITDDSKKFQEVRESYRGERVALPVKSIMFLLFLNVMATVMGPIFRSRFAKAGQRPRGVAATAAVRA